MSELEDLEAEIQSTIGPPLKRATQTLLLKCVGEDCSGNEFSPETEGCNALLSLCPECHKALKDRLIGKCIKHTPLKLTFTVSAANEPVKSPSDTQTDNQPTEVLILNGDHEVVEEDEELSKEETSLLSDSNLQIKAILSTLLRSTAKDGRRVFAKLQVNDEDREYTLADDVILSNARRHLFFLKDIKPRDLYWYEEYAALMTNQKLYLSMCSLSNGDILLAVFMTRYFTHNFYIIQIRTAFYRCNRPRCDLVVYSTDKDSVYIVKEAEYSKNNDGVFCDPTRLFNKLTMTE